MSCHVVSCNAMCTAPVVLAMSCHVMSCNAMCTAPVVLALRQVEQVAQRVRQAQLNQHLAHDRRVLHHL